MKKGLLTRDQLRGDAWIRVRRDVYADSRLEIDHALMCRAALLGLPKEVAVAGVSAAYLLGVGHAAKPNSQVHLIVPVGIRVSARRGVVIHATALDIADRHTGGALRMTSGLRTAWDIARWLPALDSVPVLDTLLGRNVVDKQGLAEYLCAHVGRRGSSRAASAFEFADGGAQSPPESRIRVRLRLAGLPVPTAQLAVRVAGGAVLHPDLAWAEYKVALEYDGLWHATAEQFQRDRRRLNLLVAEGWLVLHVTNERLSKDFPGVVREMKAALRSRGWRG